MIAAQGIDGRVGYPGRVTEADVRHAFLIVRRLLYL